MTLLEGIGLVSSVTTIVLGVVNIAQYVIGKKRKGVLGSAFRALDTIIGMSKQAEAADLPTRSKLIKGIKSTAEQGADMILRQLPKLSKDVKERD